MAAPRKKKKKEPKAKRASPAQVAARLAGALRLKAIAEERQKTAGRAASQKKTKPEPKQTKKQRVPRRQRRQRSGNIERAETPTATTAPGPKSHEIY